MTKQPPAAPVPGPNVTPEPNEKIKGVAGTSTVPGTETKPQDTLQIRKTPWHGVTKQPPAVPLPGPNVTPEPNEKINQGSGRQLFQAHKPSHKTPFKSGKHPGAARRNSLLPSLCPGQTSLLNRTKKSRVWQAIAPGTQTKATRHPSNQENTLARRDETPPAVPLPPNATPERNEKIKVLAGIRQAIPLDTLQIRKTPWHGVTKQPPAVPLPGPNVTPEPNEKSRVWQAIFPGTQNKPQDTLQIRKTPWHGVTKQPKQPSNQENTLDSLLPSLCPGQTSLLNRMKKSRFWQAIHCSKAQKASQKTPFESGKHPGTPPAVPLPGPNVTPEPNEKNQGAGRQFHCFRRRNQATGHPSNQENTLARRDGTASCRPVAPNKKIKVLASNSTVPRHKPSHKTPFKSGKHPGTA